MNPDPALRRDGRAPDDPAWLAWCYLLDELDPDAHAAFEERLGQDEEAGAALAAAARLLEAVVAADARAEAVGAAGIELPVSRSRRGLSAAVACAALVAGILVMVISLFARPQAGGRAAELVRLWSSGEETVAVGDADEPHGVGVGEEAAGDEVPGWLLTAVTLDHDRRAGKADDELGNEIL